MSKATQIDKRDLSVKWGRVRICGWILKNVLQFNGQQAKSASPSYGPPTFENLTS